MSIIAWVVFGLIAGFVASRVAGPTGYGLIADLVLGIVGAVVGGFLFHLFGATGVTGFNAWSFLVAILGAVVVLVGLRLVTGGRARA